MDFIRFWSLPFAESCPILEVSPLFDALPFPLLRISCLLLKSPICRELSLFWNLPLAWCPFEISHFAQSAPFWSLPFARSPPISLKASFYEVSNLLKGRCPSSLIQSNPFLLDCPIWLKPSCLFNTSSIHTGTRPSWSSITFNLMWIGQWHCLHRIREFMKYWHSLSLILSRICLLLPTLDKIHFFGTNAAQSLKELSSHSNNP